MVCLGRNRPRCAYRLAYTSIVKYRQFGSQTTDGEQGETIIPLTLIGWLVLLAGAGILSALAGVQGVSAGFALLPLLAFFLPDLTRQVQTLTLILSMTTALILWLASRNRWLAIRRETILLSIVVGMPTAIGSLLSVQVFSEISCFMLLLFAYAILVIYSGFLYVQTTGAVPHHPRLKTSLLIMIAVSFLSGLMGIGPGFLILPILVSGGMAADRAIATSLLLEILAAFVGLVPHLDTAYWNFNLLRNLLFVSSIAVLVGSGIRARMPLKSQHALYIGLAVGGLSLLRAITKLVDCYL